MVTIIFNNSFAGNHYDNDDNNNNATVIIRINYHSTNKILLIVNPP